MSDFRNSLKIIWEMWPAIMLAVLGGVVRMINSKHAITTYFFIGGLLSSAFVAVVVSLLLAEARVPQLTQMAMVGMSGYSSSELLGILKTKIIKRIGNEKDG